MKNLMFWSFCFVLVSCSKSSHEDIQQTEYLSESNISSNCIEEDDFMAIAEGIAGFYSELMDETKLSIQEKTHNLEEEINNFPETIDLCDLADMYSRNLLIDRENVDTYLTTLIDYKTIITAHGFSECFYNELEGRVGIEAFSFFKETGSINKRWFLSTLAAAFGAGDCITGVLAIIDTCAYVATGIITAPTGIGAVACWGGATASATYAFSTVGDNDC